MAYIGPEPNPGQNREVDDISSSFNGSTTAFTLQVNSQNVSPGSSNAIIVSLGGVVQNPGTDYTVAASTLTFTTAPASGLSFFGLVLGQQVDIQALADGTSPTMSAPTITGDLSIADKIVHTGDTNNAIRFPAADTITAETAGSERLRVDSSGTLLVGATSYGGGGTTPTFFVSSTSDRGVKIHNTNNGIASLQLTTSGGTGTGQGTNAGFQLAQEGTNSYYTNFDSGDQLFFNAGTEQLRLRSNGTLRIRSSNGGANSSTYNESTSWNSFMTNSSNGYDFKIINSNSSPASSYSLEIAAVADVNNTNYRHINCTRNSSSSGIFVVYGNGNVANANNSYGSTSDVKLKENIVDANSQWNDIKSLRVRNFNFIADSTKTKLLGLVAQEAETVCPSLVQNINDVTEDENGQKTETGTVTKELKYSVLYMKAIKALQEAQTRIETLESDVAALKAA